MFFWGNNIENNYGFGTSNISANIENRQNQTPLPNVGNINQGIWNRNQYQTPTPWAKNDVQKISNENSPQIQTQLSEIPRYWDTASEGEKVWNYVQQQEGNVKPQSQNKLGYGVFGALAILNMINNKNKLANQSYTDKYKHALINCKAAQYGEGGYDAANVLSLLKEGKDVVTQQNTLDSSFADNYANKIGRLLGTKYKKEKCETLVPKYIDQYYK